jgi:hypothetical protein
MIETLLDACESRFLQIADDELGLRSWRAGQKN